MSVIGCNRERESTTAAKSGRWPADLRAHVRHCRHCADVVLVTSAVTASADCHHGMGDPAVLWFQARLSRRLRAEAQVSRLMTAMQTIAGLVVVCALAYMAVRQEIWRGLAAADLNLSLAAAAALLLLAGFAFVSRRRHI